MAYGFPSGTNTFIPSFDATGHLVVAFSRDPKSFALNQYATITPVKKDTGYYLRVTAEVAARIANTDYLREFVWHDGDDAPDGNWQTESFSWFKYATQRLTFPFRLGYKSNEQADWKILALHAEIAAQLAMTARSVQTIVKMTTAGSYDTGHSDTATNIGGGFLSAGTADGSAPGYTIKKAFNAMAQKIQLDTLGVIKPNQLVVVLSPKLADPISRSKEIHAYLKESPAALAQVRGDVESQNGKWGLPDHLYGYRLIIEDTVRVSSKKGDTKAVDYAMSSNDLVMLARPGGLVSAAGGPNFGTVSLFMYEEMTVEQRDDPDNRRIKGRVVEDYIPEVVAPASGYYLTNCLS